MLDLFSLDSEVLALETQLLLLEGTPRLAVLIPLAWQLRQRDSNRSIILAMEAEDLLAQASNDQSWYKKNLAQITLIYGEHEWLNGDLESAEIRTRQALEYFNDIQDIVGLGDTYFLTASIWRDRGHPENRDTFLIKAIEQYQAANEDLRLGICRARLLYNLALRDPAQAAVGLQTYFKTDIDYHPAVQAWLASARAQVASKMNQLEQACLYFIEAHRSALATGQLRQAIFCSSNAGDTFATLGDLEAALEWDENSLDLAASQDWPSVCATALNQAGNVLRLLGRHADARTRLLDALEVQAKLPNTRTFAQSLQYLGDLYLDIDQPISALGYFQRAQEENVIAQEPYFMATCLRGEATALCRLGQLDESSNKLKSALALANEFENYDEEIRVLRTYAELCRLHPSVIPKDSTIQYAPLYFLNRALKIATCMPGFNTPAQLLDEIADAHAEINEFQQAFEYTRAAAAAHENNRLNETRNRAFAMQVRHENERHRAEADHHKLLAQAQANRAAELQEASSTLETLGLIGREITANLNIESVCQAVYKNVSVLLALDCFTVFLFNEDRSQINLIYGVEDGAAIADISIPLDHPQSIAASCIRNGEEIFLEKQGGGKDCPLIPGTKETLSVLYMPMMIGNRILGAMSIQSTQQNVYGERERSILRTLASYAAIAFDNSTTYRQLEATLKTLRATQSQLEEMSITDPLTGLRNRRFLLQNIDNDVAVCLRAYDDRLQAKTNLINEDIDLIFFMIDFDHFKAINDTYGHASGDMVLVQMRQRLSQIFRESDYLIRWGGEEFLVVARCANRKLAPTFAQRIHDAISDTPFDLEHGAQLTRTCSIGFSNFPFFQHDPRALSWSQVVKFADQCLYMVKNSGRDGYVGFENTSNQAANEIYPLIDADPSSAAKKGIIQFITCQKFQSVFS
jgi:diguanylate cyclase (GGDEF)-like protein